MLGIKVDHAIAHADAIKREANNMFTNLFNLSDSDWEILDSITKDDVTEFSRGMIWPAK